MQNNCKDIANININKLFNNSEYKFFIPIYQRNYAWKETEIYTLLNDIIEFDYKSNNINNEKNIYYLGTLVVSKKENENGVVYEVIDGQQRLTTLYLIYLYIESYYKKNNLSSIKLIENDLYFEIREKYSNTLNAIKKEEKNSEIAEEIIKGYNLIKDYFINNEEKIKQFIDNLKNTEIIIIHVPKNTDTITYFTIMNTRGEQLELHQIAKAKFIDKVGNKDIDRKIVAEIWDACANMDNHVQRNFEETVAKKLFSDGFLSFAKDIEIFPKDIDKAWDNLKTKFTVEDKINDDKKNTIQNIISGQCSTKNNNINKNDSSYKSIISFPYFLLYVNAAMIEEDNVDKLYDDKNLLNNLNEHLDNPTTVKKYIYYMLQCRFLFDKHIVKKRSDDYDDSKELELLQYKDNKEETYITSDDEDNDIEKKYTIKNLIRLQSILRYTYVSQRNMRWITKVLKYAITMKKNTITTKEITDLLEEYCINKIKDLDYNNLIYGNIERIVFTYLDYVLYRDNYREIKDKLKEWKIRSRTSIEHFQPQNPINGICWEENILHSFGNLALITVSDNAMFSNSNPKDKAKNEKYSHIIDKSPKLKLMASYDEWNEENMKEHEKEMVTMLQNEINRILSKEEV